MKLRALRVHAVAGAEMRDAFDYLSGQAEGLAKRLSTHIREAVLEVRTTPTRFPIAYGEFRRYRVDPFKYWIVYRLESDESILFASFFHLSRNPERLRRHLDSLPRDTAE